MLRRLKIARNAEPEPEQLFIERYDRILGWSMHLTNHDRELAEDLLHDLFIQFVLSGPDPAGIENLDGYLYISLRNLHIAQQRRANRNRLVQLSIVEYDSALIGLNAVDFRDQMAAHDELRRVCQYACSRKEHAKIASVLVLRFFHGYYPEEITRVAGSPRSAIDKWLKLARGEAKASLNKDSKLSFMVPQVEPPVIQNDEQPRPGDLLEELREMIFRSREGDHPTIQSLYSPGELSPVECSQLAHIVSCATCLDGVNKLLGLTPLKDRQATETLSRDKNKKDDGGDTDGGGTGGTGGGMNDALLGKLRRKVKDTFAHRPQELCVAVNGYALGSHRVTAERSELNLMVERAEDIDFVEIYTEQKIRLLLHNIEELPPAGPGERTATVRLSDGRLLELNLRFTSPSPTIQITYLDPMFNLTDGLAIQADGEVQIAPRNDVAKADDALPAFEELPEIGRFSQIVKDISTLGFWLQPIRLTAGFAALLILALVWFKLGPTTTVSAAELLQKSAEAEDAKLANKDRVLHRTIDLEERKNGELISRKKVDVWHSADKGVTARRLYDENGRLTMGDWRVEGGVQTIYQSGQAPKLQPLPKDGSRAITFENAWQLSVSAREFAAMLASTDQAVLEERVNDYLITYISPPYEGGVPEGRGGSLTSANGIAQAAIVLSRDDLHAIEQTFTLVNNGETRDYRFVETTYELKPANAVAPAVFEPNAELLAEPGAVATGFPGAHPAPKTDANTNTEIANTNTTAPAATLATAALEVEVIDALNTAGAFMGEQINVSRTADGKIQITALVETDQRKRDLIAALTNFRSNPAVRINIQTVAEGEARAKKQNTTQTINPTSVDQINVTERTSPVDDDLKRKFSDDEARRYTDRVLARTRQAWRHAAAMKQLSQRFSKADLVSLTPAERERWLALVRSHAQSFLREAEALRRDLAQVFPEAASGSPPFKGGVAPASGDGVVVSSDTELQARVRELYDATVAIDRGMNSSFGLGSGGARAAPVKGGAFWNSFSNALGIARSLQAVK